jgi:hypothetical protein
MPLEEALEAWLKDIERPPEKGYLTLIDDSAHEEYDKATELTKGLDFTVDDLHGLLIRHTRKEIPDRMGIFVSACYNQLDDNFIVIDEHMPYLGYQMPEDKAMIVKSEHADQFNEFDGVLVRYVELADGRRSLTIHMDDDTYMLGPHQDFVFLVDETLVASITARRYAKIEECGYPELYKFFDDLRTKIANDESEANYGLGDDPANYVRDEIYSLLEARGNVSTDDDEN